MSEATDDPARIAFLLGLEAELGKDLPNEPEVVSRVAKAIRKHCAGLCQPHDPLGRYLLIGPVEPARRLATALARVMLGNERQVLWLDMAEYSEKHQVSRLYGHNGGLVCDYFEGTLTEPLRREPKTVVLLENIEHAHRDAREFLIDAFLGGRFVDYVAGAISIRQAIFLLTTLVGYSEAVPRPDLIVENEGRRFHRRIPDETRSAMQCQFPPEMLRGTFIDELLMIGWRDNRVAEVIASET
jgi:ATP-dependent Clp protease ATP-binding subunit ClpA